MQEADRSRLIDDQFPDQAFWDEFTPRQQVGFKPPHSKLVRNCETGQVFEASHPGFPELSPPHHSPYLFREVLRVVPRWTPIPWPRWQRTGRVWRPRAAAGDFKIM